MIVTADSTDVSVYFRVVDDVGGTNPGEPSTGLNVSPDADFVSAYYIRDGAAAVTCGTLADFAVDATDAHSDAKIGEVSSTNAPGICRLDAPDAAFASGTKQVTIIVKMKDGYVAEPIQVDVIELDVHGTGAQKFNDAADCSILVAYSSKTNQNQFIVTARSPSSLSSNDDAYINRWIFWQTGAAAGEAQRIIDYVGSTGEIFVAANFQGTLGTGNGVIL